MEKDKIIKWIKNNRIELALILGILLLGAIFRLYRIDDYMTFLGDEGRDVIVVRRLLVDFDPILVGPGTSVGNMYLGPIYYYLMAPALLLANYSPVGPAVMIALFGIATIFFVWYVARLWFGREAGLVSSFLFAISPVVIHHSTFSWNPNIMPFFSLLLVYSVWKFWAKDKWTWLVVASVSLGIMLQSHYLGLVMVPFVAIFWLLGIIKVFKKKKLLNKALLYSIISVLLFVLLASPLIIFDARHGWRNALAMQTFFLTRRDAVDASPLNLIYSVIPTTNLIITRLIASQEFILGILATLLYAVYFVWFIFKAKKLKEYKEHLLLVVWVLIGIIGLSIYRRDVYDHYYGYLFPAIFMIFGAISQLIINKYKTSGIAVVLGVLCLLLIVNIQHNAFQYEPNKQLGRTIKISEKIATEAAGEQFNIAVIANQNYEGAYWYFLEHWGEPIIGIDPLIAEETTAEQLFVVCEYEDKEKCKPTSNPKTEIANFGWSKIDEYWEIDGVILFKLSHNIQ